MEQYHVVRIIGRGNYGSAILVEVRAARQGDDATTRLRHTHRRRVMRSHC